jgi:ferredoxin--NADP+ reductase
MPYKIIEKDRLNSVVWKMKVQAPLVAKGARAGQFIILRIDEKGERIPLTISGSDPASGVITIIFQEAGKTTRKLGMLSKGDSLIDLIGPLGKASDFGKAGKVALVAGGVGIAEILPIAKYAKESGNFVLTIIGARTKELLILEEELKRYSDKLIATTDDGSYGMKALVTEPLKEALAKDTFDLCYCVGPDIMMKVVSEATKAFNVKTLVSLDANMVDATGMCGTCRVTVGGKTLFTCVDGPEFDGHLVDWNEFLKRQKRFVAEEKVSVEAFESQHANCKYRV